MLNTITPHKAIERPCTRTAGAKSGHVSDEELMRRTQAGDMEAFAAIYRRWRSSIRTFLRERMNHADDVDDAIQDVFANLLRYAHRYGCRPTSFRPLIFTIARNLVYASHRRSTRKAKAMRARCEAAMLKEPTPRLIDVLATKDDLSRLRKAIRDLPAKPREAFVLVRLHGVGHTEISLTGGVNKKTLQARVSLAWRLLRQMLVNPGQGTYVPVPEGTIGMKEAANLPCVVQRFGRPVAPRTVLQWCVHGVSGVNLEHVWHPLGWRTTPGAVERFLTTAQWPPGTLVRPSLNRENPRASSPDTGG